VKGGDKLIQLISENLCEALCGQLAHEKFNANIYLFIAADLKNRGFNNLAKHFEEQHEEETGHSLIIYNLLTDLNAPVKIEEIDAVKLQINIVTDIANAYLEREKLTTDSLDEIKKLAIDESNPVVEERMRQMLLLQQAEYSEATDWLDHAELCGSNWFNVMLWDGSLK
jgi:ferritin